MEFLNSIRDFRRQKSVIFNLGEILACLIIATLHGKNSTLQAAAWCVVNIEFLRELGLELVEGVPSYDTFQRVLRLLDVEAFVLEFINWMNEIICCSGLHLAIDGKGLRGGTDRIRGGKTPYMLNIIETSTQLIIASIPIMEKKNEIKAIPEALALIAVSGNLFTIDAIGTFINIILQILEENGDFVLLVKKNNPEAYDKLLAYFNKRREETETEKYESEEPVIESTGWKVENNKGRYEYRRCETVQNAVLNNTDIYLGEQLLGPTSALGSYAFLFQTLGVISTARIPIEYDKVTNEDVTPDLSEFLKNGSGKVPHPTQGDSENDDIQVYGILSNRSLSAEEILQLKRAHWDCEAAHHILDVTFREDYSSAKKAKFNQSLVRKLAFNLVKMALHYGDIESNVSTPVVMIHIVQKDILRKYLFTPLPTIHLSSF